MKSHSASTKGGSAAAAAIRLGRTILLLRDWWVREFLELFPQGLIAKLAGERASCLVIRLEGAQARMAIMESDSADASAEAPAHEWRDHVPASFLNSPSGTRNESRLGLEIAPEACFFRRFDIPVAAESDLDRLVVLEIERRTPFRLEEIVHGRRIERREGRLRVHQLVVMRVALEEVLARLGADAEEFDFILARDAAGGMIEAPLRPPSAESKSWTSAACWLASSAVLLFAFAFALALWRQNATLADLETQIALAKTQALSVRSRSDELASEQRLIRDIRVRKLQTTSFLDIWNEATRLLPDDSWLTELRLWADKPGRRAVALSGYSKSAAALVATIARSPIFADAALKGAVTPDSTLRRERFVIEGVLARRARKRMGQ